MATYLTAAQTSRAAVTGTLRTLFRAGFVAAAVNFTALAIVGAYDVHFGPIHLNATYLFKPLLYLNAAFLLALALQFSSLAFDAVHAPAASFRSTRFFWIAGAALVAAVYGISFTINLDFPDWTHRTLTTGVKPWTFFLHRQYDGFYRPLTFVSLWIDNQIFHNTLWGYHVQNVAWHLLNGFLVARLAFRLGLTQRASEWAGIAFLAIPASFEAVIWPGARFDLMAATFTFLALERALAGAAGIATLCFCLGVLCKETAYAYPLLLAGLFLAREPLGLTLPKRKWMIAIAAGISAAILLVAIRFAVYGNIGGYPDMAGGNVNFVFTPKTFASIFTRLPAALFLINSGAGLPVWLRMTLLAYVAWLAAMVFSGAGAGRRTVFLALPFIAVLPMLNMFGWMTQFAQQGRYLYEPVIWIVFAVVAALSTLRARAVMFAAWVLIMMSAALFNTLAYTKMIGTVHAAVSQAVAACNSAQCCRTLDLNNVPRDLYGAFYFRYQVTHDLQRALPGVSVVANQPAAPGACSVGLRWTADHKWEYAR